MDYSSKTPLDLVKVHQQGLQQHARYWMKLPCDSQCHVLAVTLHLFLIGCYYSSLELEKMIGGKAGNPWVSMEGSLRKAVLSEWIYHTTGDPEETALHSEHRCLLRRENLCC